MLLKKIKNLIIGLLSWCIIGLSCIGGYTIYKQFKPVEIIQANEKIMRVKLESIGILKVAESQQTHKEQITKGKIFKTIKNIIRTYESFYEYDLKDVIINEDINNKTVEITIDTNKLILTPARLVNDESYSVTGIISATFTDDEMEKFYNDVYKKVSEKFETDEEFKEMAIKSLGEKLYNLADELGFENININKE